VPWLKNTSNICINEEDRKAAFDLYQGNRRNQFYICTPSCIFTNMYFGPPVKETQEDTSPDVAQAIFYFKKDIKVKSLRFSILTTTKLTLKITKRIYRLLQNIIFTRPYPWWLRLAATLVF